MWVGNSKYTWCTQGVGGTYGLVHVLGDLTFFWSHHHPGGLVTTREVKGFPCTLEAFPLLSHSFNCQQGCLFTFVFGDVTVQPLQAPRSYPAASPQKGMHFHVAQAVVGLEITTVSFIPTPHSPTYAKPTIPHTLHDHCIPAMPHHALPWCAASYPGSGQSQHHFVSRFA